MRFSARRFLAILASVGACQPALSDLIPHDVADARARLRANPDTFDVADQFCTSKKRGDACTLSGTAFEGGGPGRCEAIASGQILLKCVGGSRMTIDRQIPSGGFVTSDPACREYRQAMAEGAPTGPRPVECDPSAIPLTDRFCRGLSVGSACKAEIKVDGRDESHSGTCKDLQEYKYARMYGGRPMPTRTILQCEPPRRVQHVFTPATWLEKLKQ
jgi:hypothetical protein